MLCLVKVVATIQLSVGSVWRILFGWSFLPWLLLLFWCCLQSKNRNESTRNCDMHTLKGSNLTASAPTHWRIHTDQNREREKGRARDTRWKLLVRLCLLICMWIKRKTAREWLRLWCTLSPLECLYEHGRRAHTTHHRSQQQRLCLLSCAPQRIHSEDYTSDGDSGDGQNERLNMSVTIISSVRHSEN